MRHAFAPLILLALSATLLAQAPLLPPPASLPGPLVVTGGGATPESVRQVFFDLAGRGKARILVVAASEDLLKPWKDLEPESVAVFRAKDRKQADEVEFAKPLAEATGVWFADGSSAETFRGTIVEKELRKLHARGGVIGGPKAITIDWLDLLPGFHFDSDSSSKGRLDRLREGLKSRPGFVGLGIGEKTALAVRGRLMKAVGEDSIALFVPESAGRSEASDLLKDGDMVDLFQVRRTAANRAAKEPFPPRQPAAPVVDKGSLLIVGGGGAGADIWKRFIDLAGGPDSLIVFVPTALEDPVGFTFPEVSALQKYGAKSIQVLHTRDRSKADDPKFAEPLTRARGVWFGGGRQWRFVEAYEGTLTEKRFHDVLTRGGVIGGSSAGASIQSEYMPRGHPLGNTVMMAEGYEKGFSFLPGAAVDQHFFARKRTADMTALMKSYPQFLGIGIDEGTALVVKGSTAEVIGRSKAAFYDYRNGKPDGEKDYTEVKSGEKYDLKKRMPVK